MTRRSDRGISSPVGIVETWPHWDGDVFFDGSAESIRDAIRANLTPALVSALVSALVPETVTA